MPKLKKKTIKTPSGRKSVIQYTRWFPPYIKRGSRWLTTLKFFTNSNCGVYFIRNRSTRELLYVGHSGKQLYKTLYRHFQSWDDDQYRATYKSRTAYEIMIVLTSSCKIAYMAEQYYINKKEPRDGIRKLELQLDQVDFSFLPNIEIIEEEAPF